MINMTKNTVNGETRFVLPVTVINRYLILHEINNFRIIFFISAVSNITNEHGTKQIRQQLYLL